MRILVEELYPRHAAAGQATVLNVALARGNEIQTAEISPPAGVTVSGIKGDGSPTEQAIGWFELTLTVAKDAAAGERTIVFITKTGRTAPVTISIPTHVPAISDLRVAPPQGNQRGVELQVAVVDSAGDLGDGPYVWFSADCGGDPIVGALRSTVNARVVRAALPDLRQVAIGGDPANGKCDLQVRLTDSTGIESNTLKTTVEFRN